MAQWKWYASDNISVAKCRCLYRDLREGFYFDQGVIPTRKHPSLSMRWNYEGLN